MKRILSLLLALILVLSLTACLDFEYDELVYTYNGADYTRNCEYGNLRRFYEVIAKSDKTITVESELGKEQAEKIADDDDNNFFLIHDILYVKKDYKLPTVQKNRESITHIIFNFFDYSYKIDKQEEIDKLVEIILKAYNKQEFVEDIDYFYSANVEVYFEDSPVCFISGRIVVNKNGDMFYSSCINQKGNSETKRKSWYSVPLNTNINDLK
ncbi:MAG: hypothetical protein IJ370_03820 [Oscillospiraceae bacterium]|nr:hypothetical protein [Oscillospiraceae bacterium]